MIGDRRVIENLVIGDRETMICGLLQLLMIVVISIYK